MKLLYKKSFLDDLKRLGSTHVRLNLDRIIRQLEAAPAVSDLDIMTRLSGSSQYYGIAMGNYRLGLKKASGGLVFVRILHQREVLRLFFQPA